MRVGLLRSRRAHFVRAALYPLAGFALTIAVAVFTHPVIAVLFPIAMLVGIFVALNRIARARPVIESGALSLHAGAVRVGARPIAARDRVTSGVVMSGPEGTFVRLERQHGGPVDLTVDGLDAGRSALEELELDPAHAVAHFRILATSPRAWKRRALFAVFSALPIVLAIPISLMIHAPFLPPLMAPLVVAMALSTIVPARLTIGNDGISSRRFGREEFISLDGIEDAVAVDDDNFLNATLKIVRLLGKDGAVVRELVVDQKKQGPFSEAIHAAVDARAESLAERIREVIAARKQADGRLDPRTLARGDRDVDAWIRDLRAFLKRARGFRDADAPAPESLLAIVEDASADPLQRVAAAIAVAPSGPDERHRVRVAAETTAAPRLRIALEAAIDHDEQKLAGALDEIERARET